MELDRDPFAKHVPELACPQLPSDRIRYYVGFLNALTDDIPNLEPTVMRGLLELADELDGVVQRHTVAEDGHPIVEVRELDVGMSILYVPEEHRGWFVTVFESIVRRVDKRAREETQQSLRQAFRRLMGL